MRGADGSLRGRGARTKRWHFSWKPETASGETLPSGLRSGLEPLMARFGAQAVEVPFAGLDALVEVMLAELGGVLCVARTMVLELAEDRRELQPWQSWAGSGIERPSEVEGSPSRLVLPLRMGGAPLGALALDGVSRAWDGGALISTLRPLHDAMVLVLLRRRIDRDQTRLQSDLDESERLAGSGHWTHDVALGSSHGSLHLHRILRLDPRAELDLRGSARTIHPDDRRTYEAFLDTLLGGRDAEPIEVRARYGDGEIRKLRCWGEISRTADGRPRLARGVVHDVTELERHGLVTQSAHDQLTSRQTEVLCLLGQGRTMKEVAIALGVTPRTVAFHKYRMMEALGIHSNTELIQYAVAHGLAKSRVIPNS